MNGARRVIVFCTMTAVLPIILLIMPLYLRHSLYADVVYAVTESDILEISDGVSTIFCSVRISFKFHLEKSIFYFYQVILLYVDLSICFVLLVTYP